MGISFVLLLALPVAPPAAGEYPEALPAPDVTLTGVEGRPFRLTDLRGKMVFLNFWATWCVPCRQEMPAMVRLHRAYGSRGLAVVGVNLKESSSEVEAFAREPQLTFAMARDPDGEAARAFRVRGLPMTFLIDRDGRIVWRALGPREWDGAEGGGYFDRLLRGG